MSVPDVNCLREGEKVSGRPFPFSERKLFSNLHKTHKKMKTIKTILILAAIIAATAIATSLTIQAKHREAEPPWDLLASDVTATVFNPCKTQCNDDFVHTASMYEIDININNIDNLRILAVERTMLDEFGLAFGDVILVKGTGLYDGEWQIEDLMNKRFRNQHRIDFLVPEHIKRGKWENVSIYKRTNINHDAKRTRSRLKSFI